MALDVCLFDACA
ncbi:hypothetical protein ABK020_003454 [Vibrio cholerae]